MGDLKYFEGVCQKRFLRLKTVRDKKGKRCIENNLLKIWEQENKEYKAKRPKGVN